VDDEKTKHGEQTPLMRAVGFSDKDLDANRMGVLSDNQRRRLRIDQIFGASGWWFIAFICTLPFILPNNWHLDLPTLMFLIAAIIMSVGMAFWRQGQIGEVLKENKVAVRTGPIKKSRRTENGRDVYRVAVGGQKFIITENAYNWLVEDRPYNLYYVRQTEHLLSVGQTLTEGEQIRFGFARPQNVEKQNNLAAPQMESEVKPFTADEDESQSVSR
jgi:hypothetical protein